MKRFVFVTLVALLAITTSCIKQTPAPDLADAFVGNYTYTDNYYVRWGGDSKTDTMTGTFTLTKVSALEVQMHSPWNTLGRITANTITFTECPQNDSDGYVNYTFSAANLVGNQLIFTYVGTGSRRYTNGIAYPWESSGTVVATKLN